VIRGYLSGSAWREYSKSGTLAGEKMPTGLKESDRIDPPIFSPATKAESGHDENITVGRMREILGAEVTAELERLTRLVYTPGRALALLAHLWNRSDVSAAQQSWTRRVTQSLAANRRYAPIMWRRGQALLSRDDRGTSGPSDRRWRAGQEPDFHRRRRSGAVGPRNGRPRDATARHMIPSTSSRGHADVRQVADLLNTSRDHRDPQRAAGKPQMVQLCGRRPNWRLENRIAPKQDGADVWEVTSSGLDPPSTDRLVDAPLFCEGKRLGRGS